MINRNFTIPLLAQVIAGREWDENEEIVLNDEQFEFEDCCANVTGKVIGTFNHTPQTNEYPGDCELVYAISAIDTVHVTFNDSERDKYLNFAELCELDNEIENTL